MKHVPQTVLMKSVPVKTLTAIAQTFKVPVANCQTYCDRVLSLQSDFKGSCLPSPATFFLIASERWQIELGLTDTALIHALNQLCTTLDDS